MMRVLALLMVLMLLGCNPRQPSRAQATTIVEAMQFVRHTNGLCFGVASFVTYMGYEGVSITQVDAHACR